jgi:hypothetical protein
MADSVGLALLVVLEMRTPAERLAWAQAARLALVDGRPGAVWSVKGTPHVVFDFTVREGVVTAIDLIADPETIASLDITFLKG